MSYNKLPAEKARHIDPKTEAPKDWDEPIRGHGYSRNEAQKFYFVRLTVQGKQQFISCEYCQDDAAKAYDLALWKLAPKMTRVAKPNDREGFRSITQADVDSFCPKLNELYAATPFLELAHEAIPEDVLREEALERSHDEKQPSGLKDYQKVLLHLKRVRVMLVATSTRLSVERLKLPYFHKLAEAPAGWVNVEADIEQTVTRLKTLIESMEAQRAYYLKLVQSGEVPN